MAQCFLIILCVIVCSVRFTLANQLFENPKTRIIEAVSVKNEDSKNHNEHLKLNGAMSEICPVAESESWSKLKTGNDVEVVSPELLAPTTNFLNKDLYHQLIYNPGYNYYDINTDPVGPSNIKTSDAGLIRSYNGLSYPYSYPEVVASFKPYPVRYLPPVYLKNYETLPRNMVSERDLYVRTPRMLRSDDDFWEQLQNDSIMKNILPTMPIPFLRSAGPPADTPYQYSSFPYGSQDCALPIMLGCTPKIFLSENLLNYNNKQIDEVPYPHLNRQIDDYNYNKNSESSVEKHLTKL